MNLCPICDRELEPGTTDLHHLIPKQKGGAKSGTIEIHRFCHTKIHATIDNYQLAKFYNTVELLRSHPDLEKFIKWVRNKPPSYYDKNDQSSKKRNRR